MGFSWVHPFKKALRGRVPQSLPNRFHHLVSMGNPMGEMVIFSTSTGFCLAGFLLMSITNPISRHSLVGNTSNLPYNCIVWVPQNGFGNFMIQVQKVLCLQPPQTSKNEQQVRLFNPESHDGKGRWSCTFGMFQNFQGRTCWFNFGGVYQSVPEKTLLKNHLSLGRFL